MSLRKIVLVFFIAACIVSFASLAFADVVSPDGRVGVRFGGGQAVVYDTQTGQSYGSIGGGSGAVFSPDSQSVTITNAQLDSFGTTGDYKVYCRH